jgi:hypothetical protein
MTITHKFRSVGWVATVASAALACYLISYRVSAERNKLEDVERDIARAREDILELNTEFATRSRMGQIERWNRHAFVLAAPAPGQVLEGEIELASLFESELQGGAVQLASLERGPDRGGAAGARDDAEAFEAPDPDGLDVPRIRHAAYLVPAETEQRARGERIAFLDDRLRSEIAQQAAVEFRREANDD